MGIKAFSGFVKKGKEIKKFDIFILEPFEHRHFLNGKESSSYSVRVWITPISELMSDRATAPEFSAIDDWSIRHVNDLLDINNMTLLDKHECPVILTMSLFEVWE